MNNSIQGAGKTHSSVSLNLQSPANWAWTENSITVSHCHNFFYDTELIEISNYLLARSFYLIPMLTKKMTFKKISFINT